MDRRFRIGALFLAHISALSAVAHATRAARADDQTAYGMIASQPIPKPGLIINVSAAVSAVTGGDGFLEPVGPPPKRLSAPKVALQARNGQSNANAVGTVYLSPSEGRVLLGESLTPKTVSTPGTAPIPNGFNSGDELVDGIDLKDASPLPASQTSTVVTAMQLAEGLGAGVDYQAVPGEDTEGMSMSYTPFDNLTLTTTLDRRIWANGSTTAIGTYGSALGGIGGDNPTSISGSVILDYHGNF